MNKAKKQEIIEKVQKLDRSEQATVYGMIKGLEAAKVLKAARKRKKKEVV